MQIVRRLPARSTALTLCLLLAAGCGEEEPVLRVGDAAFVAEQVRGLGPEQLATLADLAALGTAVSAGRADSLVAPLVRRAAHRARIQALPVYLGARRMGIMEEQVRAAYAAAPEWELTVRHVVRLVPAWAPPERRAEAHRVAEEVARRARAGEDFAALAGELSEEPGAAERGGLLQPGRQGSWVDPFWEAALALRPGETSPVVETEYGYHVLRLDDRRALPFEEAARLPVLERLVPRSTALAAMEEWVATQPPVALDPPAVLAARAALRAGEASDSLVLARSPAGRAYSAWDLALAWASLSTEERQGLEKAGDAAFGQWVESDASEAFWADAAADLGAEPPPGAEADARLAWEQRIARWAETFGLRRGMSPGELEAAALRGVGATGQEARIARPELQALRPLLRRRVEGEG